MKNKRILCATAALGLGLVLADIGQAADDFGDGIAEYTDDAITADDNIGSNKAANINFIVVDAIGKAKTKKSKGAVDKDTINNLNDGTMEENVNSVVVEAGSAVDQVYNIVIEK